MPSAVMGLGGKSLLQLLSWHNVKDYGATGDSTTDDTAAIAAAIAAASEGDVIYFPRGGYVVYSAGTECILVNKNVSLVGEHGFFSKIIVKSTVGSSTDIIRVDIPAAVAEPKGAFHWEMRNLRISQQTGVHGQHALHLDITDTGQWLFDCIIAHCYFEPTLGRSIYLTNPTNTNGFFTSTIEKNIIQSGISLLRAGDSLWIHENTFWGYALAGGLTGVAQAAIDLSCVTGAHQVCVENNNCTMAGGFINVETADHITVQNNNVDLAEASTNPHSTIIYIGASRNARVVHNTFQCGGHSERNIYLSLCTDTLIDRNDFNQSGGAPTSEDVFISQSCNRTLLGNNPGLATLKDLGTNTKQYSTTTAAALSALPSIVFGDNFEEVSDTLLSSHTPYPYPLGGFSWGNVSGANKIHNNKVSLFDPANRFNISVGETALASCTLSLDAKYDSSSARWVAIVFRYTDTSNYLVAYIQSGNLSIAKVDTGSLSVLATNTVSLTNGVIYGLRLVLNGNSLAVTCNGVTTSVTSTFNNTATKHGFYVLSDSGFDAGNLQVLNFQMTNP